MIVTVREVIDHLSGVDGVDLAKVRSFVKDLVSDQSEPFDVAHYTESTKYTTMIEVDADYGAFTP